jgi:hypothetical protein
MPVCCASSELSDDNVWHSHFVSLVTARRATAGGKKRKVEALHAAAQVTTSKRKARA